MKFHSYWLDEKSGRVWCLSEAPNAEAAKAVHKEAGHPTDEIYMVHEGH
ncbi:MAG TPA: nickel-binding protein [Candidatus Thermoplasmatota archaeon]|nr:nickel-binding protein [Candidatus Thermoplasmatota archaeon]